MSKILVIKNCLECPHLKKNPNFGYSCKIGNEPKNFRSNEIPDWCPLPNKELTHDEIDSKVNEVLLVYDKEILDSPKGRSYGAWRFSDDDVVISWEEYWAYGGHDTGIECFPRKWLEDGVDYKLEIKKLREQMNFARDKKIQDDKDIYEREERKKYKQLKKKFGDK